MTTNGAVLLVEDNEDDVFLMKRALKGAGVTNPLSVVEDGQGAIDYLSGTGKFSDRKLYPIPTLILLDLKLPLVRGLDVLAWIRKEPKRSSIIVVVLTSSDEPSDLAQAYRLGANSYLVKPPTAPQLLDMAKAFKWYWLGLNRTESQDS
ncbi:response regulator [Pedosphaera parvula]|uniref:Response regulator receiver protein n=1 Tax=Pedosphaera parvula (strain Ellin514) TaxID=320771 RepID=B9XCE7_PEDPL|nr:response regulator [Pedosphaera parvula]EEF62615.1 response regulator receiver protein [Pedosphaera parvula Ellin514]